MCYVLHTVHFIIVCVCVHTIIGTCVLLLSVMIYMSLLNDALYYLVLVITNNPLLGIIYMLLTRIYTVCTCTCTCTFSSMFNEMWFSMKWMNDTCICTSSCW